MAEEQEFDYHPDAAKVKLPKGARGSVDWSASEYVEHQRGAGWYLILAVASVALAAVIYALQHDIVATVIILVLGLIVGVAAGRKPAQAEYRVDSEGLSVGDKFYSYSQFRSYSIMREGHLNSLVLTPLRRLMPPITAFFDSEDESKIVAIVGERLPMEQKNPDRIDNLTRRLRF